MRKLVLIVLAMVLMGSVAEAGKYETLKTPDEERAEFRAKDLALLRKNVGRRFYAQPVSNKYGTGYPVFKQALRNDSREFRVLEREAFVVTDVIVGSREPCGFGGYHRVVYFKVRFRSGETGYATVGSFGKAIMGGESCIMPEVENPELDDLIEQFGWCRWKE